MIYCIHLVLAKLAKLIGLIKSPLEFNFDLSVLFYLNIVSN